MATTLRSSRSRDCSRAASSADAGVGDVLPIGDTYGLIRFGSRVDTYFPAGNTLLVEPGQRTIGAETVHRATAVKDAEDEVSREEAGSSPTRREDAQTHPAVRLLPFVVTSWRSAPGCPPSIRSRRTTRYLRSP